MKYCAYDIETRNLRPGTKDARIWIAGIKTQDSSKPLVVHNKNGLKTLPKQIAGPLEDENICTIIHNSEFDGPYTTLNLNGIRIRNIWDTRLMEILIQGFNVPRNSKDEKLKAKHGTSLKHTLARYHLNGKMDKTVRENFINRPDGKPITKQELDYWFSDVDKLIELQRAQEFILTRDGMMELALLENKVAERVIDMKVNGLRMDPKIWKAIITSNKKRMMEILRKLPSDVHNWNSPAQVKKYFFNKGILINSFDELEKVAKKANNPTLNLFIEYRNLFTQTSKYGEQWLEFIDDDGRIRCSFEQIVDTGRFSVSDPPIHGLPKEGLQRSAFIPDKGKVFVVGDYSGQEIGIMAAAAGEKIWIDALLRRDDVHALTASIIYKNEWHRGTEKGCTFPKKCKCAAHLKYRERAKTLNYMLAYGGGAEKFMNAVGCTLDEAKVTIYKHRNAVSKVTRMLVRNSKNALATGVSYSADPYARRRVLNFNHEEWHIKNQGKNHPIQSAGANMVKLAMISLPKNAPLVFVWHDEIILECRKNEAQKWVKILKDIMAQSADYITGIKGLIEVEPKVKLNLMKG